MSHSKTLTHFPAALAIALGVEMLIPSAMAEILYDKEGIQLQGSAPIVSRNAATCNVLEEKYSPEEYEELKGNQDQPLHVWRLDFSAHNNTGKTLGFLQANFDIPADKYLRQAEQLVEEKDYEGARKAMEELAALQREHGLEPTAEDHFRYAQVWSAAGSSEQAIEAAVRYLQIRGREAAHYDDAIDLINRAEARQDREESGPAASGGGRPGSAGIRVGETVVFDGMEFVGIPPGEFLMGSTSRDADDDEQPVTRVRITKGFYLGKYEVTQAEWQAVMGNNPSHFAGCALCPVERVSGEDVQDFIGRLNARSGGESYRLPTEAEWEYAARAGTTTDTYAGDITEPWGNDPVLNGIAWYAENSSGRTHPMGRKAPNGWGLYDMLGNVWEWVGDWYGAYPGGGVTDPAGPGSGSRRVFRGGGWAYGARSCRSAIRLRLSPGSRFDYLGFRLLREE